jgi:hypothetical protein
MSAVTLLDFLPLGTPPGSWSSLSVADFSLISPPFSPFKDSPCLSSRLALPPSYCPVIMGDASEAKSASRSSSRGANGLSPHLGHWQFNKARGITVMEFLGEVKPIKQIDMLTKMMKDVYYTQQGQDEIAAKIEKSRRDREMRLLRRTTGASGSGVVGGEEEPERSFDDVMDIVHFLWCQSPAFRTQPPSPPRMEDVGREKVEEWLDGEP